MNHIKVKRVNKVGPTRRVCLSLFALLPAFAFQNELGDWTCPMDQDVHLDHPGKCPRCGMALVLKIPDRVEYPISLIVSPRNIQPGGEARLTLRVLDPTGHPVLLFETVHEKLLHLFVVSEDLEFFAHLHPEYQSDGSFTLTMRFPKSGMYRLLADFYPAASVPQLAVETIYVKGPSQRPHLTPSLIPQLGENLTASLRLEPDLLIAGLEARLYYTLSPGDGLERYLGAWGHMLIASEDLIDLMHLHPFLATPPAIQYNVIFPRPGKYKIWSQFQRFGVVNTVVFSVDVHAI